MTSYFAFVGKQMVILFVLITVGCATNERATESTITASPSQYDSETVLGTLTSRPLESLPTTTSSRLNEDSSEEEASSSDEPKVGDEWLRYREEWGIEETSISLPVLGDPLVGGLRLTGKPFEPIGAMPTGIIASTDNCDIVAIDSATGEAVTLWRYPGLNPAPNYALFDCGETGFDHRGVANAAEIMPEFAEIPPGFIDDLEWIEPGYVLVSTCCEPAVGSFEILDTVTGEMGWFTASGTDPSIDGQNRLLYVDPILRPMGVIKFATVDMSGAISKALGQRHYYLIEEPPTRELQQTDTEVVDLDFVSGVSWLDAPNLAAQLWRYSEGEWMSWVVYVDSESKVTINSRGSGWMFPTGDDSGNLVVAEQPCTAPLFPCSATEARIVIVDVPDLTPLHEVKIDGVVADMDLVRGHLLVTLSDGRIGTLAIAEGRFNVITQGVRRAVWQE